MTVTVTREVLITCILGMVKSQLTEGTALKADGKDVLELDGSKRRVPEVESLSGSGVRRLRRRRRERACVHEPQEGAKPHKG